MNQSEAYKVTKKIFDEFYHAALTNKSTPIILIFPHKTDVINYFALNQKQYAPLLAYFDSAGYKYMDLMDAFEHSGFERLKLKDLFVTSHYSPFANRLVAKFILRYLSNMNDQDNAPTVRVPHRLKPEGERDH